MKQRILLMLTALMLSLPVMAAPYRYGGPHNYRPSGETFFNGFGITFGYVNSIYSTLDLTTDERSSSAMLHGFTIGLSKDFTLLQETLYFQTGLNYIYQNDARNQNVQALNIRLVGDRTEHHLSLPIRLKYDLYLVDQIGLTFDAGPTLLMGLSSRFNYRTRLEDETVLSTSYNIHNGKAVSKGSSPLFNLEDWMAASGMYPYGNKGIKRFDVMLGASVGAHFFEILEVRLGYDWGLLNRSRKDVADEYALRRGQFTLSLGLRF